MGGQVGEVYAEDARTPATRDAMPTWRAARGEEFDDLRIWIGADQRTRRALSVSARSVRDSGGALTGAALVYKDVTEYLRALAVRDEFLSAVPHELRTPLTSVLGHLEIALDLPDLPFRVAGRLAVVERNAVRLDALVADLLEVASQREGRLTLDLQRMDLMHLVTQAVEAARPAAAAADLSIAVTATEPALAAIDARRIRQVLDNLLSNAIKYSDAGGLVQVTLQRGDGVLEVIVADDGMGIEADEVDRLFTRFFRSGEARARQIPGTGLGLVLVKGLRRGPRRC